MGNVDRFTSNSKIDNRFVLLALHIQPEPRPDPHNFTIENGIRSLGKQVIRLQQKQTRNQSED